MKRGTGRWCGGSGQPGDLLARSELCHLHDGRAEAESCAIDPKLQRQDRDVVLVARSESSQHVWVVRRSLSELINGRLHRKSDASAARQLTRAPRDSPARPLAGPLVGARAVLVEVPDVGGKARVVERPVVEPGAELAEPWRRVRRVLGDTCAR